MKTQVRNRSRRIGVFRASFLALGVAVFAALSAALPQVAQAQTGTQVAFTISVTDRQTTPGNQSFEGDTFMVTVAAGNGLTGGTLNVTLTQSLGAGEITTPGGLTFALTPSQRSITRTWTVTDDAVKEGDENVEFSLAAASGISATSATPSSGWTTTGGTIRRSLTILANDDRTISPVLSTRPADALAEGSTAVSPSGHRVNLIRTGDALTLAGTRTFYWYITIESGQTATLDDFAGLTDVGPSGARQRGGTFTVSTSQAANLGTTATGNSPFFRIPRLNDDNEFEGDETFTLNLGSTAFDSTTNYGSVALTITDNDGYTLTPIAPTDVDEGETPNMQIRYTATRGSGTIGVETTVTATLTNDVPSGHTNFSGLTGTGRACASDWDGAPSDDSMCGSTGQTIATASCTIPAATAHDTTVNCALPLVTDDTLSERNEHYRIALTGLPTGATAGDPAQGIIDASDPIAVTLGAVTAGTEGGTAATLRINLTPSTTTFLEATAQNDMVTLAFEYPSGTVIDTASFDLSDALTAGYYDWSISAPAADAIPEAHETRTYVLRGNRVFNFYTTIPTEANARTRVVTFNDDDVVEFTIRACGGGNDLSSVDVSEAATQLSSATDTSADCAGAGAAASALNRMYFRIDNYRGNLAGSGLRGNTVSTTLTYCLGGTATGATQDEITANPNLAYDYTYPIGYDPTSTSAADSEYPSAGTCTTGRGTVTIPAAHTARSYRFSIALNNDDLNEGDETITAELVAVSQGADYAGLAIVDDNMANSGYGSSTTGQYVATRTIKDDDAISISIANAGTDADGTANGFQVEEGGDATFTVTLDHASAGEVIVRYSISGDVVAADYSDDTRTADDGRLHIAAGQTSGTITIGLTADADTAAEDLTVTLDSTGHTASGTIARSTTASEQSATQSVTAPAIARTLTLTRYTSSAYDTEASGSALPEDTGALYFAVGAADLGDTAFSAVTAVTWTVTHAGTNGTSAADFSAVTGSIMHPASACSAATAACQFTVTITDDDLDEFASEGFSVVLSVADEDADGGTNVGTGSGALTITDNDRLTVNITGGGTVNEGGNAVVTIRFTKPADRQMTIDYSGSGGAIGTVSGLGGTPSATDVEATLTGASSDFGAFRTGANAASATAGTTITFDAGQTTAEVLVIPVTADNLNEAAENFRLLTFSANITGHYIDTAALAPTSGGAITFTIAASDAITASLAAGSATYNEGQTAQFTVTLTGATSGSVAAITVPYTVTLTDSAGYTLANLATANSGLTAGTNSATGSITIAAGDTSGNIDLVLPVSSTLGASAPDQRLAVAITQDDATTTETNEGISVAAGGGTVSRSGTAHTGNITVNFVDAARTLTVTGPTDIAEGDSDSESGNYTITRTGTAFTASSTTVTWTVTNVDTVDADFSAASDRSGSVTFAAADTTQTFTLTVAGDNINEAAEAFTVQVSVANPAADGGTGYGTPARTEIRDDDPVEITISRHSSCAVTIAESAGNCRFDITIGGGSRPTGAPGVFVFYQFGGTGITAGDIGGSNPLNRRNFLIGQNTSSVSVTAAITDDDLNEATETLTVTGDAVGPTGARFQGGTVAGGELRYASGGNTASVMITDNDNIVVSIANQSDDADDDATGHQVNEGGNAVFRISIDHESQTDVTVPFSITGLEMADYTGNLPTSPATITAGDTHVDLTIALAEDTDTGADEMSEAVTVTLDATGHTAAGSIARATGLSNYAAVQNVIPAGGARTLTVTSTAPGAHPEGNANAMHNFTITRDGAAFSTDTEVTWTITHGSPATSAADFTAVTGTVTFRAARTTETFDITIVGDTINEAHERFSVQVSVADANADSGTDFGDPQTVTITDDDDIEVRVTASSASVAESAAGNLRDIVFTVDLGATLSASATAQLHFATAAEAAMATVATTDAGATLGTRPSGGVASMAAAGHDYFIESPLNIESTLRVRINSGQSSGSITLRVVDDDLNESTEVIVLGAGAISPINRASSAASGANTETIGSGGSAPIPAAVLTITDNDAITYGIARRSGDTGNVREGGMAHFTITLSGASAAAITIPYTVSSGSYSVPAGTVIVPANTTEHTFALPLPADTRDMGMQTLTINLGNNPTVATGGGRVTRGTPASVTVTAEFASSARALRVSIATPVINETDANVMSANITIGLGSGDTLFTAITTVNWEVVHGSTEDADFVEASDRGGTVSFDTADRTTDTFTIDIAGDNRNEADETFTIRAWVDDGAADGGTAPGVSMPITIRDDDPIVLDVTTSRGAAEGTFNLTFNFGALASRDIVLTYALGNTSATGDVDAVLSDAGADLMDADGGSVTLATTATQVTIDPRITITDDTLNEAAETFTLSFAAADITGAHGAATFHADTAGRSDCTAARCAITYTIAASDPATVSIARRMGDTGPAPEGGMAHFTVTLAGAASGSAADISVPYTVAAAGSPAYDVASLAGSVTITAGQTSADFSITLPNSNDLGTAHNDPAHTLTVTLTADDAGTDGTDEGPAATGANANLGGAVTRTATPGGQAATVDIEFINAAHSFELTTPATTITERDTDVRQMYTITRTGDAITGTLSIGWAVAIESGQTASTADFDGNALPSGTVNFSGTQTTRTFNVEIEGDNLNEANETFTLNFTNATSSGVTTSNGGVSEPSSQAVTITDDDAIVLTTSTTNNGRVSEGGNAVVTVNLGAIPSRDITVGYAIDDTTATDDVDAGTADYTNTSSNSITITAAGGVATGTIMVAITADNLNESAETFVVRISAGNVGSGAHGTVTVPDASADAASSITLGAGRDETLFTIAASDPITYSIARASGTMATEDEGQTAEFTVSISGASAGSAAQIQIPYTVTSSGAYNVASGDQSGMVTFAAGVTTAQTITLSLRTDGTLGSTHADQTLTVQLGNSPTVASGGGSVTRTTTTSGQSATVRVNFIDSARTLTVTGPATHAETNTSTEIIYTVTLRGMPFTAASTSVNWAVTHGTTADADFVASGDLSSTITFSGANNADGGTRRIAINIVGDTLNEADETFTLQVSVANEMADGGTASGSPVTTTITDNDPISVNVAFTDTSVTEDAAAGTSFTITLTGARSGDVEVPFRLSGLDNAEYDIDAQTSPGATDAALTIDSGGTSGAVVFESNDSNTFTVDISLTDDNLNEATETLTVTGAPLVDGTHAAGDIAYTTSNNGVSSVMITDTDAISVTIARASSTMATVEEGSTAEFTVTLANAAGTAIASAGSISVAYTVDWDDATFTAGAGLLDDMTPGGSPLTIAAGQTSGSIRVRVGHSIALDDTMNMSPNEDFTVELGAITVGTGGGTAAEHATTNEVTVAVDWIDAAHTIEVADAMVDEGAATITVTRSASMDLVQAVDIMWAITHGTTEAADFNGALEGSVRFSGSQETATIRLPIVNDNLAEMSETFTLTLSENIDMATQTANSVVAAADSATVTITDNDNIRITIGGPSRISEERAAAFTVTLSATPSAMLTANWAITAASGGTLADDGDCSAPANIVPADEGDFAVSVGGAVQTSFPSGTLPFTANRAGAQSFTLYTSAGTQENSATGATASATGNGYDQTCDRQFTITVTTTDNGGGSAVPMDATVTITISEDNPEAIAELNESVLPEVARAVATNQVAAIAERIGAAGAVGAVAAAPQFNLNGQSSAAGMTAENLREWANGSGLSTKEMLRDMDFTMPLSASGAAGGVLGENRMALWGGSDYRDFSGEGDSANKPKWDGEMFSLHVGADARVNDRLLVGVMLSHSDAESDYSYNDNGRTVRGDYDLEMTGFSPYLSWDLPGGTAWFSAGYGQGDLTIDPDEAGRDTMNSDVDMTSLGAGGARVLRASEAHELRLKGDAFVANIDVDGDADNENLGAIDVDANRLRVLVESRHNFDLASGAKFTPLVDMGARYDGGDGNTGSGIEVGGGVHYAAPGLGLTVETRARVLLGHSGDQDEWGVGGVVRLAPGADGQGLSLSLSPSYGDSAADTQGMWDNGVAGSGSGSGSRATDPAATMAAEIAYGMSAAFGNGGGIFGADGVFGGAGMLTPYSALHFGDKNDYRMGLRWNAGQRLNLDLSARHLDTDNRVTLEGKLKF